MGLCAHPSNRSSKTKIGYFVLDIITIGFGDFFKQYVLGFYVTMDEVLFMDTF